MPHLGAAANNHNLGLAFARPTAIGQLSTRLHFSEGCCSMVRDADAGAKILLAVTLVFFAAWAAFLTWLLLAN
jgi:hypothetical protein